MTELVPPDQRAVAAIESHPAWWMRLAIRAAKLSVGKEPTPWRIMARTPLVFLANALYESTFMRSRRAPAGLKVLAAIRSSQLVGCPW